MGGSSLFRKSCPTVTIYRGAPMAVANPSVIRDYSIRVDMVEDG